MEDIKKEAQPFTEQANVLNLTEEESADSCEGSSNVDTEEKSFGKFKSSEALLEAYNSLQAEFTKKCQRLSELEKEKTNEQSQEKQDSAVALPHQISFENYVKAFVELEASGKGMFTMLYNSLWLSIICPHTADHRLRL